ncbi:hypothetical protein PAPYR_10462 [Paratrimastix pyriformis]|uniref:Uncharacterized protein n=1 Tax=Paratrimastix pyriformis TaxID=342808 RepID=A0ABQ8U5V3_9EUKA|nr:hypothetical protein PAPYR_10462 [Paratrimastix pyriformis]
METLKLLLLHLDDQNPAVQQAAFGALQEAVRVNPTAFREEIEKVRNKHRDPTRFLVPLLALCDQLDPIPATPAASVTATPAPAPQ